MTNLLASLGVALLALTLTGCQQSQTVPGAVTNSAQLERVRADELTRIAKEEYDSGNLAGADRSVGEALLIKPGSAELRILAARIALDSGRLDKAARNPDIARRLTPDDGQIDYLAGVAYERGEEPEVAYPYYQQAAAKSPAEPKYLLAQSQVLEAMNRSPEAIQLLQSHLGKFPVDADIRDALGQLLMEAGNDQQAALMLREATIFSRGDLAIRQRLAVALYAVGEYQQTEVTLARLVVSKPFSSRADLFIMLGDCQLRNKNIGAARDSFATATRLDGLSSRAWQGRGQAELQIGNMKIAERFLMHSVWMDASNSAAHLALGYARMDQNRYDDALASFKMASQTNANDTESICMIGYTLEKLGQSGKSVAYYQRALQMKPDDQMASKLMASLDLNDLDK